MKRSKKNNIDSWPLIKKISIFVLCVLCLPLIDFILIKVVKNEPIFTFQTKELDNGGALEYYGFGYKIIKCNIDEDTTTKFGFFTMEHSCKIDNIVEVDTSREYNYAMSSIRGIPFEIKCTKDLSVKAFMDENVDVGLFYKENDQHAFNEIETTCNSIFYFQPKPVMETLEDVKVNIQVNDGKNKINKIYIIDYIDNFFRAYNDNFTIIEPKAYIPAREKIYEDNTNKYYLNSASVDFFISYPEIGRIKLTDALDSRLVSIKQLIRRGLPIITEEKAN